MKKTTLILILLLGLHLSAKAGGLMTNTNYHIAFDRMMARGATFNIDAAYSNPAGLAWGHEGWQLSFNWQNPHQNRDVTTTFPLFTDPGNTHKFHGKATSPFVPGLFAAYKKDRWALSTMIGIVGSGGYVRYDDGLPMFTAPIMAMLYAGSNGTMTPQTYDIDAQMKGKQYVYGAQLNFTYRLTDNLSAAVGLRANYYDGYYRGHVVTTLKQPQMELINIQLDASQRGWGFNPLVSVDYRIKNLTLTARYEFRTKINVPNKTHALSADLSPVLPIDDATKAKAAGMLAAYQDGVKTRYDLPALLSLAAGYEFTPNLRATVEYHYFDDRHAKMASNRQKELTHGTRELLAGVEYDINKTFTISAGAQRTDYGLADSYQSHTSFACDSYSIGLGGVVHVNQHVDVNLGYFWTNYSDYTKTVDAGQPGYQSTTLPGTDVFSRTNKVFGLGIDYKF